MRSLRSSLTRIAHGRSSSDSLLRVEQLPRNLRRLRIELDLHLAAAGQVGLELDGDQQIEQRAADLLIAVLIVRRGRHELA